MWWTRSTVSIFRAPRLRLFSLFGYFKTKSCVSLIVWLITSISVSYNQNSCAKTNKMHPMSHEVHNSI